MSKSIVLQFLAENGLNLEQHSVSIVPGNLCSQITDYFRNYTTIRGRLTFLVFAPFDFDHLQNNQVVDTFLVGTNEHLRNHIIQQQMNPNYFSFSQHVAIPAHMPTITI